MCDYSLELYSSRPARVHERYETTRFHSGSIGLAVPGDCKTAVCLQYGAEIMISGIPLSIQQRLGVEQEAEATFVRLKNVAYRDGLEFANGARASLQQFGTGVGIVVTELAEIAEGDIGHGHEAAAQSRQLEHV